MPNHLIRRVIIFGAVVIMGIVLMQGFWLWRTYDLKDNEFDQTIRIALTHVADKIASFNNNELPKREVIRRQSSNSYSVNINGHIDKNVLEDFLLQEFEQRAVTADFEYAVYNCHSKEMVYGSYCKMDALHKSEESKSEIPAVKDLTYYFVVRFPSRTGLLLSSMWHNVLFTLITLLALAFFIYAMWVILEQKKLSELQRDFINNMTHEFKTPISSIKIASDYIRKDKNISADPRLKKYAEIITSQNERLNNQVENVLNLAKMESDSFKLKKEVFDIKKVLQNITQSENTKAGHQLITADLPTETISISADKLHFSNVIYNILDNAIKYCQQTPQIILRCYEQVNGIILEIRDNGIGMSKEELDMVFKKFYRVSTGDVHDVKGFGLGLYYVQTICQSHGWQIDVDSQKGQGSTFTIKIPNS